MTYFCFLQCRETIRAVSWFGHTDGQFTHLRTKIYLQLGKQQEERKLKSKNNAKSTIKRITFVYLLLKTDGNHGEVIHQMKEHNEVSNFHNSTYVRKSIVSALRQAEHQKRTPVLRPYDLQLCF